MQPTQSEHHRPTGFSGFVSLYNTCICGLSGRQPSYNKPLMLIAHMCCASHLYYFAMLSIFTAGSGIWQAVNRLQGVILDTTCLFIMFQLASSFHREKLDSQRVLVEIWKSSIFQHSKLSTGVKAWSSTASVMWRLSEELGVQSVCNFCCNSNLCCSVMWVITTNQSWRLPYFPPHFPPGKANYNRKAANSALWTSYWLWVESSTVKQCGYCFVKFITYLEKY